MTDQVPDLSYSPGNTVSSSITFRFPDISPPEEIIRLDSEGFHYRGQLIEDAGEAHRLFIEFMRQSNDMRHINQPNPDVTDKNYRNPECVEAWPECWPGGYDPHCCRFPKPCSCDH